MRTFILALLLVTCACTGAPTSTAPAIPTAATEAAGASEANPVCPPIDPAALEPPPAGVDARRILLSDVFPREEARAHGAAPARFDLGVVPVSREAPPPPPPMGGVQGMGWHGLDPSWVEGLLSEGVVGPFRDWIVARGKVHEGQNVGYLLDRRAGYLTVMKTTDDERRCVVAAKKNVDEALERDRPATDAAAGRLVDALRPLAAPTVGDKLVLGVLLEDRVPRPRAEDGSDIREPLRLFAEIVNDAAAPRELRARAAEQRARALVPGAERAKPLEEVLAITGDPDLRVETLIKLAVLADTTTQREERLVAVVKHFDGREPDWRLAHALGQLAELRLERGAFALARDDAARCARVGDADEPDPWQCGKTLADALAELGGADQAEEVPLVFLGPLALASMEAALGRFDRNQARHVGELLLARLPAVAEAAKALDLLVALERDPQTRRALVERRARDYGPKSAWLQKQRERIAWHEGPDRFEQELARLTAPPSLHGTSEPTTAAELDAELRQRLDWVIDSCGTALAGPPRKIVLRIDTTGPTVAITTSGAPKTVDACLRRGVGGFFRSVQPARIEAQLVSQ